MKKKKSFEVILSTTDILGQELADVLGGNSSSGCRLKIKCNTGGTLEFNSEMEAIMYCQSLGYLTGTIVNGQIICE